MLGRALAICLVATPALAAPPAQGAPTQGAPVNCTDVQVGSAQGYDCLNAQLGAVARATQRPSSADAPVSAASPSNVVGTFNEAGTRETLARRPAAVSYPPPLPAPR
ncbi:MAG TPA: hypothetical protein VJK90_09995 [Acetobacteraceae bacterium]|jgi:hypothetical protein|nr:hypothetical protein [Acetobacteraceae bacterium]